MQHHHHFHPRFLRLGRFEIMVELIAPLIRPSQWQRPSTKRDHTGGLLMWAGPLHIAVGVL